MSLRGGCSVIGRLRIEREEGGLGSRVGLLWAFKMLFLCNQSYKGGRREHRPGPVEDEELRQSSVSLGKSNPP